MTPGTGGVLGYHGGLGPQTCTKSPISVGAAPQAGHWGAGLRSGERENEISAAEAAEREMCRYLSETNRGWVLGVGLLQREAA